MGDSVPGGAGADVRPRPREPLWAAPALVLATGFVLLVLARTPARVYDPGILLAIAVAAGAFHARTPAALAAGILAALAHLALVGATPATPRELARLALVAGLGYPALALVVLSLRRRDASARPAAAGSTPAGAPAPAERDEAVPAAAGPSPLGVADEIVSVVSHDLRNPLNTIRMAAGLLDELALEGEAGRLQRRNLEIIGRAVDRMNRLIQDLVDSARLESRRLAVTPEPISAQALLHEAADQFAPLAAARRVRLALEPVPAVMVRADRDRILQALGNVVENALRFTPDGGTVTVSCSVGGDALRVAVRDEGPGIPAVSRSQIFSAFWRADRNRGEGLGLGLTIARGIVEAHDGTIVAEDAPGQGAVIALTLPLAPDRPPGGGEGGRGDEPHG
jgi:signal transduction histidine kinase